MKNRDEGLREQEIKEIFKLEFHKAKAYDEKVKKYSCEAQLAIADNNMGDIRYESQLDDNGQHVVSVMLTQNITPNFWYGDPVKRSVNKYKEARRAQSAPVGLPPPLAPPAKPVEAPPAPLANASRPNMKQSKNMDFLKNYAVTFDCSKAGNNVERRICANPYLGQLDGLLYATYKNRLDPQFGTDKKLIKKQQREWLKGRNACTSENCIKQAYQERIKELCAVDTVVYGVYPTGDCDLFVEEIE